MNSDTASASVELLRQSLATPDRGIPAIVNDLFQVARRHAVHLEGAADTCRVRINGADEAIELPLRKSVLRTILAHVAVYCKKQNPDVTSPYGGRTTVTLAGTPVRVAFTNSAEQQSLELTPAQVEPTLAPPQPEILEAEAEVVTDDDMEPQQQTMTAPRHCGRREQYIPLRRDDLIQMLAHEECISPAEREQFLRFCDIYSATLHFEYKKLYDSLKNTYAAFDPECTTITANELSAEERKATLEELFVRVDELLRKANFVPLTEADLKRALAMASEWGINMQVDMTMFEKVQLYMRGDGVGQRARRPWYAPWKETTVEVPTYSRLALIIKLKKDKRFPKNIDTNDVFLKYFKDIPQADIEMLLPGARMVMPGSHRLKLGGSLISGFGVVAYQIFKTTIAAAATGIVALWGLPVALLGYGWRQYAGYQSARHACSLRLTESLYFQTLANNAGVLYCLLDEAEEQDAREAILAYYFLWKHAGPRGMTMAELDKAIEADLAVRTNLDIDFEVDDALAKLEKLNIVSADRNGRYVATPIEETLERLDCLWDNQFTYHKVHGAV